MSCLLWHVCRTMACPNTIILPLRNILVFFFSFYFNQKSKLLILWFQICFQPSAIQPARTEVDVQHLLSVAVHKDSQETSVKKVGILIKRKIESKCFSNFLNNRKKFNKFFVIFNNNFFYIINLLERNYIF